MRKCEECENILVLDSLFCNKCVTTPAGRSLIGTGEKNKKERAIDLLMDEKEDTHTLLMIEI